MQASYVAKDAPSIVRTAGCEDGQNENFLESIGFFGVIQEGVCDAYAGEREEGKREEAAKDWHVHGKKLEGDGQHEGPVDKAVLQGDFSSLLCVKESHEESNGKQDENQLAKFEALR